MLKKRQLTQAAGKALDQAGVIEKWPLQIKQEEDGDPVPVNGVYRVSEQVLNSLDAQTFAGLRNHGALALAYAQVFSINQITQLTERAKYQARQKQPDTGVLLNPDDDMIRFE